MKQIDKKYLAKAVVLIFVIVPLVVGAAGFLFGSGALLGAALVYTHDLPEIPDMDAYQPKTVSTFYSDDGTVIGIFYKQKRFVVGLDSIPVHVRNAFIAAEDSRFYEHPGVDWLGVARATLNFIRTGRVTGASTITQQVTRNFLLSQARKLKRKIKEIALARRMELKWTKDKILSVYLNEIYLGEGCYGVEAAALNYFDKHVQHLTLPEAALLAGIVPSPSKYNPFKNEERAHFKKEKVLDNMLAEGMISQAEFKWAKNEKLEFRKEIRKPFDLVPDFAEAVRRYVVGKYGEAALYHEGLKVFTTCRVDLQQSARKAMEKGLSEIKARQKQLAILRDIDPEDFEEFLATKSSPELNDGELDKEQIYKGLVTEEMRAGKGKMLRVQLSPEFQGIVRLESVKSPYRMGHYLALKYKELDNGIPVFEPDETPNLQGALVSIENKTGYVKSLVGGSSKQKFGFNRATQAKRQPGSAFKPIIYATALEYLSYSPATVIVDEEVEINIQGPDDEWWQPKNSGGSFIGPISLRRALELSRNICTIKILMDIMEVDFDLITDQAKKMGIKSRLGKNLSLSLGASEVSLFELTSAYTVFPNSGVLLEPVLVRRIEDRHGNVLEDNTVIPAVEESDMPTPKHRPDLTRTPTGEFETEAWNLVEKEVELDDPDSGLVTTHIEGDEGFAHGPVIEPPSEPIKLADSAYDEISKNKIRAPKSGLIIDPEPRQAKPALSPQTAYIMTSLLQGVVKSGTGRRVLNHLKRKDLAGKTGTTNHAEDTWFIGFNPEYTSGVWVGYDEKRPLGRREGGSRAALPIWCYFMKKALEKVPETEFPLPQNIVFKEMFTFTGNSRTGPKPTYVEEPVYAFFAGETLAMCPVDPFDLQELLDKYTPETRYGEAGGPGQPVQTSIDPYFGHNRNQQSPGSGIRANVVQPGYYPRQAGEYRGGYQRGQYNQRPIPVTRNPAPRPAYNNQRPAAPYPGRSHGYGQPAYPAERGAEPEGWVYTRTEPEDQGEYYDDQAPRVPEFDDQPVRPQRPTSLNQRTRPRER